MEKTTKAPPEVISQFNAWRSPIRGKSNPENQTNVVWSWLIQTRAWPYKSHDLAGTGEKQHPGWCFDRYGQSVTQLPDGTLVYIGGEHEDSYDPDFYIYNDVVVQRPDGSLEIYGYPTDVFPPTDFHSATLCGDEIIIIGGLRYPKDRNRHETFVFKLHLSDFSIHRVTTSGIAPAWLYDHKADLESDGEIIKCSGGMVRHGPTNMTIDNLTAWELDLGTNSWFASATKPFKRWILLREDGHCNDLWGIKVVAEASLSSPPDKFADKYRAAFEARGLEVDRDLFYSRFSPPIPHSVIETDPDDREYNVHRILVAGVVVRFLEDMDEIAVTVEGKLNTELLETLQRHGLETYSRLEGVPYKLVDIL